MKLTKRNSTTEGTKNGRYGKTLKAIVKKMEASGHITFPNAYNARDGRKQC